MRYSNTMLCKFILIDFFPLPVIFPAFTVYPAVFCEAREGNGNKVKGFSCPGQGWRSGGANPPCPCCWQQGWAELVMSFVWVWGAGRGGQPQLRLGIFLPWLGDWMKKSLFEHSSQIQVGINEQNRMGGVWTGWLYLSQKEDKQSISESNRLERATKKLWHVCWDSARGQVTCVQGISIYSYFLLLFWGFFFKLKF